MNKVKAKKLLQVLSDDTKLDFSDFDASINTLKESLKQKIEVKTLGDVNTTLSKLEKRINFEPILESAKNLQASFQSKSDELYTKLESKSDELAQANTLSLGTELRTEIENQVTDLKTQLAILESSGKSSVSSLLKNIGDLQTYTNKEQTKLSSAVKQIFNNLGQLQQSDKDNEKEIKKQTADLEKRLETLRKDLISKLASIGGGSINRKVTFNGVDQLTRYTDMNWKAGSNVTLTIVNNDTTKMVDVTVSSSGGAGTTRSIKTITVSSVIGSLTGTDQVILANAGVQITLPNAVSDTNLYTIKNIGTSSILIGTTGGQTIDTSSNLIMPVQFTSVDLVSDNSNWQLT